MLITMQKFLEDILDLFTFFTKKACIFPLAFINTRVYFRACAQVTYLASHNQLLIELKCFTGTRSICSHLEVVRKTTGMLQSNMWGINVLSGPWDFP